MGKARNDLHARERRVAETAKDASRRATPDAPAVHLPSKAATPRQTLGRAEADQAGARPYQPVAREHLMLLPLFLTRMGGLRSQMLVSICPND